MSGSQPRPLKKMATIGLAGTVMAAGIPHIANASDSQPSHPDELLACVTTPPSLDGAPTPDDIASAQQEADETATAQQEANATLATAREEEQVSTVAHDQLAEAISQASALVDDAHQRVQEELATQQQRNRQDHERSLTAYAEAQARVASSTDALEKAKEADEAAAATHRSQQAFTDQVTKKVDEAATAGDPRTAQGDIDADALQRRIDELTAQQRSLTEEIASATSERDRLDGELTGTSEELRAATDLAQRTRTALDEVLASLDGYTTALNEARENLRVASEALAAEEAAHGENSEQAHAQRTALAAAQADEQQAAETHAQAQRDIVTLTDEHATATAALDEAQRNLATEERAAEALNSRINELERQMALATETLTATTDELTRTTRQLHDLTEEHRNDNPVADTFTRDELIPPTPTATAADPQPQDQPAPQVGVYTTFDALLHALRTNESSVRLGGNIDASTHSIDTSEPAYVTTAFSGTLDGENYSITGLRKPLFATLNGATIQNLNVRDADIHSTHNRAATIAQTSTNGTITNVHATGYVQGNGDVAGIVAHSTRTTLSNLTMSGDIRNTYTGRSSHVGGVVGRMNGGTLTQGGFHGRISATHGDDNNNRVGGVVGYLTERAHMDRVYAGGEIINAGSGGQVGGIVGSTWSNRGHGRVTQALAAIHVDGGRPIHGDANFNGDISNSRVWEGESGPGTDRPNYAQTIPVDQARAYYATTISLGHDVRADHVATPATQADDQNASRTLAKRNYERLLPFASAEIIARAVALLEDSDALVTKRLTAVIPTIDGRMVADSIRHKDRINGLILHYADRTVEHRALVRDDRQPTEGEPAHYYMANGLPYTPDQRFAVDEGSVATLADDLRGLQWDTITPNGTSSTSPAEQRGVLYLEDGFNNQKAGLSDQIRDLIARERTLNPAVSQEAVEAKIRTNRQAFLLGLAYVNRWYDVAFGNVNLRDVTLFRRDFLGSHESPVDLLISLGSDYGRLVPSVNQATFATLNAHFTGRREIGQVLDDLRRQFTRYSTFDDWFKATTRAYIVETPSVALPSRNVQLSKRLLEMGALKSVLLPILTVPQDTVFVTVDMSNITFGSFERYVDTKLPADQAAAQVRARVDDYAVRYRDYYDMWYRIGDERMRRNLQRNIVTWDSLMRPGHAQAPRWGNTWRSVNTFLGPIGRWFGDNNSYAYADGSMTWMVDSGVLVPGRFGPATFIHEQTHNMDGGVMLGGYGRRQGAGMEMYAKSFLENPWERDYDVVGFNQVDHLDTRPRPYYLHNERPSRFQSTTDLNQYFKGWWEALYVLDNAEAEAMLERTNAEKTRLFLHLRSNPYEGRRHLNTYEHVTVQEFESMALSTIDDLIDNELMMYRRYAPRGFMRENGYWDAFLLEPLYGTGESHLGLTGETAFRRNAFELLGAKGFFDGWVPYVSNKHQAEAARQGKGNLPDTFIMPKIFADDPFSSLKEYRKDAYRRARERAATQLKPVTVTVDGEQMTFTNYEDLVAKFRHYVDLDLKANLTTIADRSKTFKFKASLFSQFMRDTSEFRRSIFRDGDDALVPWQPPAEVVPTSPAPPVLHSRAEWEVATPAFANAVLPTSLERLESYRVAKAELESRIAQLEAQIGENRGRQDEARAERATAGERASEYERELERQRQELERRRTALDLLRRRLEAARTQAIEAAGARTRAQQRQTDATAELARLAGLVEAARGVERQAVQLADGARVAQEDAGRQTEERRADDMAAIARVSALQAHVARLMKGVEDAEAQRDAARSSVVEVEREIARLNALSALVRALGESRRVTAEAAHAYRLAAEGHQSAQASAADAQAEAAVAEQALRAAAATLALLDGRSIDEVLAEAERSREFPTLSAVVDELAAAHARRDELVERLRVAHEQLAQARQVLAGAQAQAEDAAQRAAAALARVEELREARRVAEAQPPHVACVSKEHVVITAPVYEITDEMWLNLTQPELPIAPLPPETAEPVVPVPIVPAPVEPEQPAEPVVPAPIVPAPTVPAPATPAPATPAPAAPEQPVPPAPGDTDPDDPNGRVLSQFSKEPAGTAGTQQSNAPGETASQSDNPMAGSSMNTDRSLTAEQPSSTLTSSASASASVSLAQTGPHGLWGTAALASASVGLLLMRRRRQDN